MGMGFAANYVCEVDRRFVRGTCPAEWKALEEAIGRPLPVDEPAESGAFAEVAGEYNPEEWVEVARSIAHDDWGFGCPDDELDETEKRQEAIKQAWEALRDAFGQSVLAATDRWCELSVVYHDSETDGSRYDDIDGIAFALIDGIQLSPAAKAINDSMSLACTMKGFVSFG